MLGHTIEQPVALDRGAQQVERSTAALAGTRNLGRIGPILGRLTHHASRPAPEVKWCRDRSSKQCSRSYPELDSPRGVHRLVLVGDRAWFLGDGDKPFDIAFEPAMRLSGFGEVDDSVELLLHK
jgi:hypothetical protein